MQVYKLWQIENSFAEDLNGLNDIHMFYHDSQPVEPKSTRFLQFRKERKIRFSPGKNNLLILQIRSVDLFPILEKMKQNFQYNGFSRDFPYRLRSNLVWFNIFHLATKHCTCVCMYLCVDV